MKAWVAAQTLQTWIVNYIDLLWYVTDGCPILDSDIGAYDCPNYSSITCGDARTKMDIILRRGQSSRL